MHKNMMVKIACQQCGHVGIVSAERLPAELRCWQCGATRHVESGERITNRAAVLEWLLGASGAPRVTERKL
jgi:ribosomal protein S27E